MPLTFFNRPAHALRISIALAACGFLPVIAHISAFWYAPMASSCAWPVLMLGARPHSSTGPRIR